HAVGAAHRFQFVLPNAGVAKHFLACLTAQRRFPDQHVCQSAYDPRCHLAPAQRRGDKNNPPDLGSVTKEKLLPKIFTEMWRKRYFVGRPAENFHPKLIAAIGKQQSTDATTHTVSNHHDRFELGIMFFHLIEFLSQNCGGVREWVTGRITVKPKLVMLSD